MLIVASIVAGFALYLIVSFHTAVAQVDGTVKLPGLQAPVTIIRDERDIPHIIAHNERDLFVAQGYAEGSDRLFQMDLTRHAVYGRLAEWFGARALKADERSRIIDVRDIVDRQFGALTRQHREQLQAFADGVNAAMRSQPTPFEYHLLWLRPEVWTAKDSLAVGFYTVLDLADSYRDVLKRDHTFQAGGLRAYNLAFPLSDPKYDVPIVGAIGDRQRRQTSSFEPEVNAHGSNEWAAGGARTVTRRPLLANDPHLDLNIPGIWYLIDLRCPGYHVAGASLAGTPGVILGHNDAIAWGATNGTVAALSVFDAARRPVRARNLVTERFSVRFARAVVRRYERDADGFNVSDGIGKRYYVLWSAYRSPLSPLNAFDALDRSTKIEDAFRALSTYPGPTQNFVIAAADGRAAYTLAGWIPNDPLWATRVHQGALRHYPNVPFAALPHVAPSRSAVVFTANNRMYGDGYPYRLSATFAPPYRAFRIHQLLQARRSYDVAYFASMQNDTYSAGEAELAHLVVSAARRHPEYVTPIQKPLVDLLAQWDGHFAPRSAAATFIHQMRVYQVAHWAGSLPALLQALRAESARTSAAHDRRLLLRTLRPLEDSAAQRWGDAGATEIVNPLNGLGIRWLNGATLRGEGDNYTLHAQTPTFSQSFRAVWDVGNWDAGGIVIPCGESGEPASPHYRDLTADWEAQKLVALPFTPRAVQEHARAKQTLTP